MKEKYAREIINNLFEKLGGKITQINEEKGLVTKWAFEKDKDIFLFTDYEEAESFPGNKDIDYLRDTGYNIIPIYLEDRIKEEKLISRDAIIIDYNNRKVFYSDENMREKANIIQNSMPRKKEKKKREDMGFVTIFIIGINILAYLITAYYSKNLFESDINVLIKLGAKYNPFIENGEYYRLLTAGFLHGGIIHLGLNMLALYSIGPVVEKYFGVIKYILIYCFSLVLSSYSSYIFSNSVSIGASGAIFGLLGSLLIIGLTNRNKNYSGLTKNILNVIIINLIIGFTIPNIDNYGHVGGLLGGAFITYVLIKIKKTLLSQ